MACLPYFQRREILGTDLLKHVSSGFGKKVKRMVYAFKTTWLGNSGSKVHPQDKFYVQLEVYGVGVLSD